MADFIEVTDYNEDGEKHVLINIDNICAIKPYIGNYKCSFIITNDYSIICKESVDIIRHMLLKQGKRTIINNACGRYEEIKTGVRLIDSNYITDEQFVQLADKYNTISMRNCQIGSPKSEGELMKIAYKDIFHMSEDD